MKLFRLIRTVAERFLAHHGPQWAGHIAFCTLLALFPFLIGALSKQYGLGTSIGIFAVAAYGVVIVAALTLPEPRGRELDAA